MVRKTLALLLKREEKGGEGERRMTQESSLSVYLKDSPVSKQRYGRSSTHTLIHNTGSTATLVAWVESQSLPTDSLTAVASWPCILFLPVWWEYTDILGFFPLRSSNLRYVAAANEYKTTVESNGKDALKVASGKIE